MKTILATSLLAFSFTAHAEQEWHRHTDCVSIDFEQAEQIEVSIDADIARLPFVYQATVLVYAGEAIIRNEVLPVTREERGFGGGIDDKFVGEGLVVIHQIGGDPVTGTPTSSATAQVALPDGRTIEQRMSCH